MNTAGGMKGILPLKQKRLTHRRLLYVFDWIVIGVSALIGGLLYGFVPVRQHLFRLDDPNIAYPYHPDIITFGTLMLLCFVIPITVIALMAVFVVKSKHDFHHAAMGLCQTVALLLVTTAIVKIFLGGLRPHFLERCNPDMSKITNATRHGWNGIYLDTSICQGEKWDVNDAQSAFPSGHSALAAGGLNFLSLYLNGKFKVFQHQGHLLVYMLIIASSFGSVLVGFTRVVDYHHTFYNVMMGWSMGFMVALSMYRLNYVSLFGPLNHVPVADTWREQDRQVALEEHKSRGKVQAEDEHVPLNRDVSHLVDDDEDEEEDKGSSPSASTPVKK